jgi:alpha/beta hydrolase fold
MPFATALDVRLYYEELGSGEPLLLIYGQGGDHTGWDGVRDDFADSYRIIVFDHRGTGLSDKPEAPSSTTRGFADDAVAILDNLSIPRAHAYDVSMGGRIGQWLGIPSGPLGRPRAGVHHAWQCPRREAATGGGCRPGEPDGHRRGAVRRAHTHPVIPGAELYIVQGGRHGYFEEFREEASRVVLGFLAQHPLLVPSRPL